VENNTRSDGGSYENVSRIGEEEVRMEQVERIEEEIITINYRRAVMPEAIYSLRDQMGECSFRTGHVLRIEPELHRIYCIHCPAEWFNEGY
jgi:hypothetical protein